ncbi:MAG TPA: IPT/TIG domain-containing protein [Acidimicrobiia bacterium]
MFVLVYFTALTWFGGEKGLFTSFLDSGSLTSNTSASAWASYLILLGGPFANLAIAKGMVTSKVSNGTLQKTVADDGTVALRHAITDDNGDIDLVDTQYLLFNLVAITYVIIGLATQNSLPVIPPLLLALTGTSAAAYTLNKALDQNAPTVNSIVPSSARAGDTVVINGSNFMPEDVNGRMPAVTIDGRQATVSHATDSQITTAVPPGTSTGARNVIVTTAAKVSTDATSMQIVADTPTIVAIQPPVPHLNQEITIDGTDFLSGLDGSKKVTVFFDNRDPQDANITALPNGIERVVVDVPPNVATAVDVAVKVRTTRGTETDPQNVTFAP